MVEHWKQKWQFCSKRPRDEFGVFDRIRITQRNSAEIELPLEHFSFTLYTKNDCIAKVRLEASFPALYRDGCLYATDGDVEIRLIGEAISFTSKESPRCPSISVLATLSSFEDSVSESQLDGKVERTKTFYLV